MRTRARFERAHCSVDPLKLQAPAGYKTGILYNDGASRGSASSLQVPCGGYKMDVLYNLGGSKDNATTGAQRPRLRRLIPKT